MTSREDWDDVAKIKKAISLVQSVRKRLELEDILTPSGYKMFGQCLARLVQVINCLKQD